MFIGGTSLQSRSFSAPTVGPTCLSLSPLMPTSKAARGGKAAQGKAEGGAKPKAKRPSQSPACAAPPKCFLTLKVGKRATDDASDALPLPLPLPPDVRQLLRRSSSSDTSDPSSLSFASSNLETGEKQKEAPTCSSTLKKFRPPCPPLPLSDLELAMAAMQQRRQAAALPIGGFGSPRKISRLRRSSNPFFERLLAEQQQASLAGLAPQTLLVGGSRRTTVRSTAREIVCV